MEISMRGSWMIWTTAPSPEKPTTFKSSCNKETEESAAEDRMT
jgi:hypothetical protein